jgi:uncharacterized membrane protein (DUF485 family)
MNNEFLNTPELLLTSNAKNYLNETRKWTYFLSIIGFVGCVLLIIIALFSGALFSSLSQFDDTGLGAGFSFLMTFIYIFMALIYFIPCYYLFNFSKKLKIALLNNDNELLEEALKNQKSLFKFFGISTIIMLSLYLMVIIFGAFAALALQ